ncbi:hypothetical protein MCP_0964 [Methanocella paludicola SANAE]|uniref:Uncharacterized protein n=1 Tax=Methanocella paludicola (strain DSM 17711 / JCM 13418 / NBRC 101707 / SANAE) TaxID=304371 RepID=D1YX64_METPS|nr:hypothetical protein [Methanocella paludicola]BAI61036.1 hypothetical protein MCP_0964 [Methanocella paludicola SANAE]
MEINADKFIKIMKENFNFKIVNTELGPGIKMDKFSAFIFSSITGAGYLDNPVFPFTPKGLTKLFYNSLDYKFVTGLFDNTTLKNTPYNLYLGRKYLFNNDKIIVPVEFNRELELQNKLKTFYEKIGVNSTDYIIQRIEKSKNGNGMEPFLEYLTCEYFKKEKYIVETQIPLSHSYGTPDFGGYRSIKYNNFINTYHIPLNCINILELSLIRLGFKNLCNEYIIEDNNFIVGEAKTSTKEMTKQLDKYLSTGLFCKGYEIYTSKIKLSKKFYGLIYIDNNYKLKAIEPTENFIIDEKYHRKYDDWISNYFKYYLIANLTNDEFNDFYIEYNHKKISSTWDIVQFINRLTYKEIIDMIPRL